MAARKRILVVVVGIVSFIICYVFIFPKDNGATKGRNLHSTDWELPGAVLFNSLPHDSSDQYRLWYNVKSAQKHTSEPSISVTIATQCSLNKIYNVIQLLDIWRGPVSIAVFVVGDEIAHALEAISYMRLCHLAIAENATFHIVMPDAVKPSTDNLASHIKPVEQLQYPCSVVDGALSKSGRGKQNYARKKIPFPVNLLRNVALWQIETSHVMVIDADMLPSDPDAILSNLQRVEHQAKTALVVPAFEVETIDERLPRTRRQVLGVINDGKARQFYAVVCPKCHEPTNYEAWRNLDDDSDGFEATWRQSWEPFYIVRTSDVILYDERFKQFGYNRISQVCELHTAAYQFYVLCNAFLIHNGLKRKDSFHASQKEENDSNRILYLKLKTELQQKYPFSNQHC